MTLRKNGAIRQRLAAVKQGERTSAFLRSQGITTDYKPGNHWTLPRIQFQALCTVVGSYEGALAAQPKFCPWPPKEDGTPHASPPPHIIYSWYRELLQGDVEPDEKVVNYLKRAMEADFKHQTRTTILEAGSAVRVLAKRSKDKELSPDVQVQMLYNSQAHNYALGNLAQYEKAMAPATPQNQTFATFNLNAGTPPPSKRLPKGSLKKLRANVIEAKFREVPVGNGDT